MSILHPVSLALIFVAALGYAAATIALKMGSHHMTMLAALMIVGGLLAAVFAERIALRRSDLAAIYIAILGVETLIVMAYAWVIGEAPSNRQIGGAALVIAGLIAVGE